MTAYRFAGGHQSVAGSLVLQVRWRKLRPDLRHRQRRSWRHARQFHFLHRHRWPELRESTAANVGKALAPTGAANVTIGAAAFATPATAGTFTINGAQITVAATDTLQDRVRSHRFRHRQRRHRQLRFWHRDTISLSSTSVISCSAVPPTPAIFSRPPSCITTTKPAPRRARSRQPGTGPCAGDRRDGEREFANRHQRRRRRSRARSWSTA